MNELTALRPSVSALSLVALLLLPSAACDTTCADSNDPACRTPSPCPTLRFACTEPGFARLHVMRAGERPAGGLDALASPGDWVLENDQVVAVIDALDHPHYVAPTGGMLLDLASQGGGDDSLSHLFHAVGLLPEDSVAYESIVADERDGIAAIEVRGRLAGHAEARVVTRYEMRPCEPGIRVRTELVNGTADPRTWTLVDAWYWSGREALPFVPRRGEAFSPPGLVSPIEDSWQPAPYFAAASHADPAASYGEVSCSADVLYGFHSAQLSAVGTVPRVVPPRDAEVFERFIAVHPGRSVSSPIDSLLEVRSQLQGEAFATLSGTLTSGDTLGPEARLTLIVEEGRPDAPPAERLSVTQVTPDAAGRYEVRVPANRHYTVRAQAFGVDDAAIELDVATGSVVAPPLSVAQAAHVSLAATLDGREDELLVFVSPADGATARSARGALLGGFNRCAPLLGSPTGASPACDRVLVRGSVELDLPPGRWDFTATAGLFATLARETVEVRAGQREQVTLALSTLPLQPEGTLSADFHVHGAASFDSTIPDLDRVRAFLAARVQVIAATDHDVVWDYRAARDQLGADERLHLLVGTEATGHILFDLVPGASLPQVIGHWNAWPMSFLEEGPYRGAPWDELAEPGLLMTRFADSGWDSATGVFQLNHPWAAAQFGRDLGFPRAVGLDALAALPTTDDGTGQAMIMRTPRGARFGNGDYHAQEVMNGTENEDLMPYRAYWFYLLNQGVMRAGTANSDSHSLVDNVLGTPRTLVATSQTIASFDETSFNRSVRRGEMTGTNGPVIEASIDGMNGLVGPRIEPFRPAPNALLHLRVSAAPWVPIDEIRIVVNGVVERTLAAELTRPAEAFGTEGTLRFEGELALAEILPNGSDDVWIVVEAGEALPLVGDLDCDGISDTGDNDGNAVVDARDVDQDSDDDVDADDAALATTARCARGAEVGPIRRTPEPPRASMRHGFATVTPHGFAHSFTNPFVLDRDGNGFQAPGLRRSR